MPDPPETFRFGDFELDGGAYELRRNGRPVPIERQPMDLLLLLLERRRQLVQRSEIVDRLWGKDVFVDVETGVHTAIRKVRRALRDSPDAPRFVETVPGKGYRFIATVEVVGAPAEATPAEVTPAEVTPVEPGVRAPVAPGVRMRLGLGLGAAALLIGLAIWLGLAEQIRLRLSPGLETAARRQTQSPDAYDLYLRGRNFENQRTPATTRQAIAYYTRATELDPNYALAQAAIARVLSGSLFNGDASPAEVLPRLREAARRAVQADPASAEAQHALAYLNFCCDWNWPAAETGFRRAVELDPRFANSHLTLGHVLSQMGRHGEAAFSTRRARELDPLLPIMPALSSQVSFQARDYREALDHAGQAIVLDPEFWIGHMMRGQALEQLGQYESALEALTTAARFSGQNSKPLSLRAYVLAKLGRTGEARGMLRTLESISQATYIPPYAMALINAGLGEREAAYTWLERALEARDVHVIYLTVDPKWDSYRADPRFEALIARCGFRRTAVTEAAEKR